MSYTLDTSKLDHNMAQYRQDLHQECKHVLKKSSLVFGEQASKWTPPFSHKPKTKHDRNGNTYTVHFQGQKNIPNSMYKRPIYELREAVNAHKGNTKLFIEKLREGYKYFVKGKLQGKLHFWFAKSERQAAKFTRIFNRGLMKFLFGANFASIGEQMPSFFRKLLAKSPNLAKHSAQHVLTLHSEPKLESITIKNEWWHTDSNEGSFKAKATKEGERSVKRYMKKEWTEWERVKRKV